MDNFSQHGHVNGYDDADTWISEQRPDVEDLGLVGRPGTIQPDESLINALGNAELRQLIGADLRDDDGWTPEAQAWLTAYNQGYVERVAEELAARAS